MSAPQKLPPVFVVGTGRCGSTLLSRCLGAHPEVLSLSELLVFAADLGGRIEQALPEGDLDGEGLWRILGGIHPRQTLMLRHDVMMEEALYRPGPGRRFTKESGIPAIAATTLPHLSPNPDALFDTARALCAGLPRAPAGRTYAAFLDRLRDTMGRRVWVERSGGSLRVVRRLRAMFPEARFVHIVRDGRDTALSISRHLGFRMMFAGAQLSEAMGADPYENSDRSNIASVPEPLRPLLPEHFDAAHFRAMALPPAMCGAYWSGEIAAGLRDLAGLGAGALLTLRYEDLLAHPHAMLDRFFRFVMRGEPGVDVAALATGIRRPSADRHALPAADAAALDEACAPGFAALAAERVALAA
jgi:putative sulfotransferase